MAALRQARASLLNCVVLHNNPTDVMVLDCPLSCALPNTFSQIHQKEFIWILTIYKPNWSVIFLALHCSRRIKTRLASVLKQFSTWELIFLPCDAQQGLPISIVHPHNFPRFIKKKEDSYFPRAKFLSWVYIRCFNLTRCHEFWPTESGVRWTRLNEKTLRAPNQWH